MSYMDEVKIPLNLKQNHDKPDMIDENSFSTWGHFDPGGYYFD